jgi:hypothetical protein
MKGYRCRRSALSWNSLRQSAQRARSAGMLKRLSSPRPLDAILKPIARFLLLPFPPFGFTHFAGQEDVQLRRQTLFSELDFDYERENSPLPDLDICMTKLPELCAGILAFDIVVANPDRRRDHLWCDHAEQPTRLLMIDHDFALFGPQAGIPRLDALTNDLGLRDDLGEPEQENFHPFLRRLPSSRLLDEWYNRFLTLSSATWYIREVCREAEQYGVSRRESNAAVDFLEYRSRNLEAIISSSRPAFTAVRDWSEGLLP